MAFLKGVLKLLSGKGPGGPRAEAARRAELRGELAEAAELWGRAGQYAEAARVMILRGDGEVEPARRMPHYTQALSLLRGLDAPARDAAKPMLHEATRKRALLVIALSASSPGGFSEVRRRELTEAGRELEEIGEPERAVEAYRLARDREAEARALTSAGDVDQLETLLAGEQGREREERRRRAAHVEIEEMCASGRRREALERAEALSKESNVDDRAARERAADLRARKAKGPTAKIAWRARDDGARANVVFGAEIVVGRAEADLIVPSHAVSRHHLRIARDAAGNPVVVDLGSRNGTQLRGMAVQGTLVVEHEIALTLGKEVRFVVAPSDALPGAVSIDVAGDRYVAPLGPLRLPFGPWRLELASDGWIELVSEGAQAFVNDVILAPRATLLTGDQIATERGGPTVLEILAPSSAG